MREGRQIGGDILPPHRLPRHAGKAVLIFDMPLAPMSQAPQLHIAEKGILAKPLPQGGDGLRMGFDKYPIGVVGAVAFAIGDIVILAVLGFLIQPVGDIPVRLIAGQIADEAEHHMLAGGAPLVQVVGLFDGLEGKNALRRLQLPPGHIHINQCVVGSGLQIIGLRCEAHDRVFQNFAAFGKRLGGQERGRLLAG